ncbi:MAG TPA: hypothetical protein VFF28_00535 [Candidatus Nanoarchaeia archaeon]|nr:hypothetical protein [Candidatus Nanoarchaeia archaeon]
MDDNTSEGDKDEDIYNAQERDELMEDDHISPVEQGFMEGATEDGQGAKCRYCGSVLMDNFVEQRIDSEIYRFCSIEHAERFKEREKKE